MTLLPALAWGRSYLPPLLRNSVPFASAVPLYWKTLQRRAGPVNNPSQTVVRCLRSFVSPRPLEGVRDSDPANSAIETGSPVNFATVPIAAERKGQVWR